MSRPVRFNGKVYKPTRFGEGLQPGIVEWEQIQARRRAAIKREEQTAERRPSSNLIPGLRSGGSSCASFSGTGRNKPRNCQELSNFHHFPSISTQKVLWGVCFCGRIWLMEGPREPGNVVVLDTATP